MILRTRLQALCLNAINEIVPEILCNIKPNDGLYGFQFSRRQVNRNMKSDI